MKNGKQNGKVAFITGANRGLGLETARELGKQGIIVVLGSRDPKKGEAAVAKLRDEGITAESLGFDVINPKDHEKAYDHFAKKYGRLDILVNNAGVLKETQISATGSGAKSCHGGVGRDSARNFRNEFFCAGCAQPKVTAAHTQSAIRPDCECLERSGFAHTAFRSEIANLPIQDFRLRRIESCAKLFHDSPGLRTARQQDQGELRASRLGEDRYGRP
jgi:NAD(P)-dependent dehydrogenase (short-subunit alcohol dehydrogenase family)